MLDTAQSLALASALQLAQEFEGATHPNPPVGASAIDSDGRLLAVGAHKKAGGPHAEIHVIEECIRLGVLDKIHTLAVTLEPCNHQGRTPPCTQALLKLPSLKKVIIGAIDHNPNVSGSGAAQLKSAGIEVLYGVSDLKEKCEALVRPFLLRVTTGLPWVTIKTAHLEDGSMIPPPGTKTFTSPSSLVLAHQLRKVSDAIITGSGTVIADHPEFTVRHVTDHPGKRRWLMIMDRAGRVSEDYMLSVEKRGLIPHRLSIDFRECLKRLGEWGANRVLVEAGPTLTQAILGQGLWNEHVAIYKGQSADRVVTSFFSAEGAAIGN